MHLAKIVETHFRIVTDIQLVQICESAQLTNCLPRGPRHLRVHQVKALQARCDQGFRNNTSRQLVMAQVQFQELKWK